MKYVKVILVKIPMHAQFDTYSKRSIRILLTRYSSRRPNYERQSVLSLAHVLLKFISQKSSYFITYSLHHFRSAAEYFYDTLSGFGKMELNLVEIVHVIRRETFGFFL